MALEIISKIRTRKYLLLAFLGIVFTLLCCRAALRFRNYYFPPIPPTPTPSVNFFHVETVLSEKFLTQPTFSADAQLIAARSGSYPESDINQLLVINLNLRQVLYSSQESLWSSPVLSPNGKQVAARGEGGVLPGVSAGIYLVDWASDTIYYLTQGNEPAWSPDGQLLALVYYTVEPAAPQRQIQIRIFDLSTRTETILLEISAEIGTIIDLVWSSDQTKLAFVMVLPSLDESGNVPSYDAVPTNFAVSDLYTLDMQGNLNRITNGTQDVVSPNFSPDGSKILYVDRSTPLRSTRDYLYVVDMESQCHRLDTSVPGIRTVTLSPLSDKVAFYTEHGLLIAETEVSLGSNFWVAGEPCS